MGSEHRKANESVRREQVDAFLSSGLTEQQWCAENGVSPSTLRYWKRKIREEDGACGTWVEVGAALATPTQSLAIIPVGHTGRITVRIGPFSIDVQTGSDPATLASVLSVAASLC
jgi:hypothetical protein